MRLRAVSLIACLSGIMVPASNYADDLWSCNARSKTIQSVGGKKKTITKTYSTLQTFPNIVPYSQGVMGWIVPQTGLPISEGWNTDGRNIYTAVNLNTLARDYYLSYCLPAGLYCINFSAGGGGKGKFRSNNQTIAGTEKWAATSYASNTFKKVSFNTTLKYTCTYSSHLAGS
jgi:hypothetical protein